jgi:shikimate dehydrogenase
MKRACVIGWPIAHSRSPIIHGYWLRTHGIDGSYTKEPVQPDAAARFLSQLRQRGFVGCNVTAPHKRTAYAIADRVEPAAQAVGAANTLWYQGDTLIADNTDGIGFMSHLRAVVPTFAAVGATVAMLGAGGAARALTHAFLQAGVQEVRIFNRTREHADELVAHFGARVKALPWEQRIEQCANVSLLVNATSLGSKGATPLAMDVDHLAANCVVADIVYVPLETPLLAAARARGLAVVDGLGMLLHQAVPGFARWFGVRPQVTQDLVRLVVADIEVN